MKIVEVGNNVKVHYIGTLEDGTEFDSSHNRGEALQVQVGSPGLLPAFDQAIVGMTEGETKEITITAEEGYGERNPEAFQTVPKEAFGPDFAFTVGETVQGNGPYGPFLATIKELQENEVVLDMNHPLAGETLKFQIEMLEIITEGG
tara:strand:+ start:526 stop:966 length:441 start_codon:yes stop_codon:yes gene_type:complete